MRTKVDVAVAMMDASQERTVEAARQGGYGSSGLGLRCALARKAVTLCLLANLRQLAPRLDIFARVCFVALRCSDATPPLYFWAPACMHDPQSHTHPHTLHRPAHPHTQHRGRRPEPSLRLSSPPPCNIRTEVTVPYAHECRGCTLMNWPLKE